MTDILFEIIADVFDLDKEDINDQLTHELVDTWDSLNHLRLITAVEGEFDIKISMEDISAIFSVADLKEVVSKYQ